MTRAETLAGLTEDIAGHDDWCYGHGAFIRCDCGAHVGFPDDDGMHKGKRAHAAHVAAVALAWLEGHGWGPRGSQANRALLDESWVPVETGEDA